MENLRGIALMVLAMAGFAVEDMLIKLAARDLPTGQIIAVLGAGGFTVFALLLRLRGQPLWTAALWSRPVILRNLSEAGAGVGFVLALSLIPLSTAAAILQATPLAVTLGGALFLGAAVGWRRWTAIAVGFLGVLLIVRPGMAGFTPGALLALLAVVGLAMRDLVTRTLPASVTTLQLSAWGFGALVPTGLILLVGLGEVPLWHGPAMGILSGAVLIGVVAYYAITGASRIGEIAVVTPFRYTRLVFALGIGYLAFSERPDALTLAGAALVVGSGLYTLIREARLSRASARQTIASPVRPDAPAPTRN